MNDMRTELSEQELDNVSGGDFSYITIPGKWHDTYVSGPADLSGADLMACYQILVQGGAKQVTRTVNNRLNCYTCNLPGRDPIIVRVDAGVKDVPGIMGALSEEWGGVGIHR